MIQDANEPTAPASQPFPVTGERAVRQLAAAYYLSLVLAGIALAVSAASRQRWSAALWGLSLIALGIATERGHRARRWSELVFVGFVALAALTLLWGAPVLGPLLGIAAAIGVWDLHHFRQRLRSADRVADQDRIIFDHLRRLGVTLGSAVAIAGLALGLRFSLAVGVVAILSLVLLIGLSRGIAYLRREGE